MRYIFIDYLQLLTPNEKSTMRQEQVSSISRDLKLIAKEFNITVVALAQLSREVEKRPDKRPKMSDLRESGSMEQDADIILLLYRDEYYLSKEEKRPEAQQSLAEIVQAKFKEGATGVYDLSFIPEYMYFSDYINDEV
jgi:replicative DNA helicase